MNKDEICKLLPHTGNMCLLDKIITWDESSLEAQTLSHQDINNPLVSKQSINSIIGIEYAAQTMAIHAVLLHHKDHPNVDFKQNGYLATVRNIQIFEDYLSITTNNSKTPLTILVSILMKDNQGYTYNFEILSQKNSIISGRLTIFLV